VIRATGGNNITPENSKFHSAIRMCVVQQLLMPPVNGNCEVDACVFLISCADLLKNKQKFKFELSQKEVNIFSRDDIDFRFDNNLSDMNIKCIQLRIHEEIAIGYIAGWACSKLSHTECVNELATKDKDQLMMMKNNFITMKEYEECNLYLPLLGTLKFVEKIVCLFNNNIENLLRNNKHGIRSRMLTKIDCYKKICPNICQNCRFLFIDKILHITINSFIKKFNNTPTYKQVKSKKLKKVMHL